MESMLRCSEAVLEAQGGPNTFLSHFTLVFRLNLLPVVNVRGKLFASLLAVKLLRSSLNSTQHKKLPPNDS